MALSREQFTELRKKGLSVDQIVSFERGNKPRMSGGQFTVPKPPEDRQAKIAQYQQEAQKSEEEAKKANSFMGILGNTLKGIGGTLANSEVGLGQSIAKIIGVDSKTTQGLQKAEEMSTTTQVDLLKRIREKEARKEDTTRLKQAYNQLVSDPARKEVQSQLQEATTMPTTGQVVGQLGGTALDVLTAGTYSKAARSAPSFSRFVQPGSKAATGAVASGLPELAPIARQQAGGLFTMKGAGNIATGAGIGYASDVTQGLQGARGEERTGAKAFIPGMGTALGTALPVISETAQSVKNVKTGQGTITKRRTALDDIEKRYSNVQKVFANADRKGVDVRGLLSETNLLNGAVDEDGLVSAGRALENFDEMVAPYEGKIREAIQKEGAKVRISDLAGAMDDFVSKSTLESGAYQKLNNELLTDLKGLQAKYGDNIPVEALHDTKIFRGNASNYVDTGANVVNKEATRFFKEAVENNVRSMDVKEYNGELSKLYTVRDAIEALDKKRVKGGRMGKYFSSVIGTGIGASSGNPLLAILGAEIGARTQGAIMGRSFGGQLNKSMDIPESLINMANKRVPAQDIIPPVVIPKKTEPNTLNLQSKSLGSLNTSQPNTSAPTKNSIPKTILPVREVSSKGSEQSKLTPKQVNDEKVKELFGELPTQNKEMFAGAAVGFEKDENGEWTFNKEKAMAGMVGVAGLTRSQAVQKLSKDLDSGTRKIMTDFIDAVRLNMTKKAGRFEFKNAETMTEDEARKAFDNGLKLIQGAMGEGLENKKIQQSLPDTLAKFYEDVVGATNKKLGKIQPKSTIPKPKGAPLADTSGGFEGQYLYHGTSEQLLDSIAKDGLKPGMRGQLSLSKDEGYARSYAEGSKFPAKKGQGVVFRVNSDLLKGKTTTKRLDGKERPLSDQKNELLTKETIPPEAIEILKDGKWQPLVEPNPLYTEARKYKSVEEFVKAVSGNQIYGHNPDFEAFIAKNRSSARPYDYSVPDRALNKEPMTKGDKVKIFRVTNAGRLLPGDSVTIYDPMLLSSRNREILGIPEIRGDMRVIEQWIPKKDLYQDGGNAAQVYMPDGMSLTDIWKKANRDN